MIRVRLLGRSASALAFALSLPSQASSQMHCDVLRTSDSAYAGRCFVNSTTIALLVLRPPQSGTIGVWRGTGARVFGEERDSTKDRVDWAAFSPVSVSVGATDSLFSWCWCKVTLATVDTEGLHFDADGRQQGPATAPDVAVLSLARSYFVDSTHWNRRDTRSRGISYCPRNPNSRTIYCALYDATVTVRGEFYLSTPANGAVRDAIGAASPRDYQHPLTDFNNDSLIDFRAMTRMLDDAVQRMRAAIAKSRGGA